MLYFLMFVLLLKSSLCEDSQKYPENTADISSINNLAYKPPVSLDPKIRKALLNVLNRLEEQERTETASKATENIEPTYRNHQPTEISPEDVKWEYKTNDTFKEYNYYEVLQDTPVAKTTVASETKPRNPSTVTTEQPALFFQVPARPAKQTEKLETLHSQESKNSLGSELYGELENNEEKPTSKPNVSNSTVKLTESKENEVEVFEAPLLTAFTLEQDERGLPRRLIPLEASELNSILDNRITDSNEIRKAREQQSTRVADSLQTYFSEQKRVPESQSTYFQTEQKRTPESAYFQTEQKRAPESEQTYFQNEQKRAPESQQTYFQNEQKRAPESQQKYFQNEQKRTPESQQTYFQNEQKRTPESQQTYFQNEQKRYQLELESQYHELQERKRQLEVERQRLYEEQEQSRRLKYALEQKQREDYLRTLKQNEIPRHEISLQKSIPLNLFEKPVVLQPFQSYSQYKQSQLAFPDTVDRQLQNLFQRSGIIQGKQQEDFNIVSKVLALNYEDTDRPKAASPERLSTKANFKNEKRNSASNSNALAEKDYITA